MQGFKKCSNGHYYNDGLPQCPYCSGGATGDVETKTTTGDASTVSTGGGSSDGKTQVIGNLGTNAPTTPDGETVGMPRNNAPSSQPSNRTVFITETPVETNDGRVHVVPGVRSTRRLVGWLVTYTLDPMGVDFKLYEGRNIIGHDADCNITVDDNVMSGKHAILLFRADRYSLTDSQSSNGTFVNDEDIDLEPRYLNDGDVIRMGKTTFKFRTSL
ncbi:MAG: FHA domain-containing protein [Candidatus Symbiothrix sp.]|jgi:hypothetical protein|nr:FHA domain-containing protein [Candidatus Symbiothrix sp.]